MQPSQETQENFLQFQTTGLSTVHLHAEGLVLLANQDHTHSVYDIAWQMFLNFISVYSKDLQFLHDINLVEFMGFMSLGRLAASTITTYISSVRHKLKLMGKDDFQHSYLLKLVLHGTKNSGQQPDVC